VSPASKKKGFNAQLYIEQILKPVLKPIWDEFKVRDGGGGGGGNGDREGRK
jgi:hypothetical protein